MASVVERIHRSSENLSLILAVPNLVIRWQIQEPTSHCLVKIRFEQPLLANSVVNLIDGYIFHLAALERGALCGKTVVRAGDGRRGRHQEHYVIGWWERAHPSLDSALEIFQSQRLQWRSSSPPNRPTRREPFSNAASHLGPLTCKRQWPGFSDIAQRVALKRPFSASEPDPLARTRLGSCR